MQAVCFVSTESKLKSKLIYMNSATRNDNEIMRRGSAIPSLSWKHYWGLPLPSSCHRQDNIPCQDGRGVRNCLFRAEEKSETHLSANSKDSSTGVWKCNTSRKLQFILCNFRAILGWSVLLSNSAGDMQEIISMAVIWAGSVSRDATFVLLLKISPYSEIPASKYAWQAVRTALD